MDFLGSNKTFLNSGSKKNEPEAAQKNAQKTDCCVLCGEETVYNTSTPISARSFYVSGCGQLCENCFKKMYF